MVEVVVEVVTDTVSVVVVKGVGSVTVVLVTPQHEHAELYADIPAQALA